MYHFNEKCYYFLTRTRYYKIITTSEAGYRLRYKHRIRVSNVSTISETGGLLYLMIRSKEPFREETLFHIRVLHNTVCRYDHVVIS